MILEYIIISGGRRVMGNVRRIIGAFLIVFILIVFFMMKASEMSYDSKQTKQTSVCVETMAQKILRFHIRAKDDSDSEQQLKLYVKDYVVSYMGELTKDCENVAVAREALSAKIDDIENVADRAIEEYYLDNVYMESDNAISYEDYISEHRASVYIGREYFPVKIYGEYTFPQGEYEALIVDIGAGDGRNWWCVLYPPLCYADAIHPEESDDSRQKLKDVLTNEEYDIILTKAKDKKIKVHFKYLTFLNELFDIE